MQHPFINDLSEKSLDDLQNTMQGLYTKLNFAYRTRNQSLIHQVGMALESYKSEYYKRMDQIYKKQNIDSRINVSNSNDSTNP